MLPVFGQNVDPNCAPAVGLIPLVVTTKDRIPAYGFVRKVVTNQ